MSKYSSEIRKEAIEMMRNQKRDYEIRDVLGVRTDKLRKWRKEEGLPPSDGSGLTKKVSDEIRAEAITQLYDGKTDTEISKSLGISRDTVRSYRREIGLPPSGGGRQIYTTEQLNDVIDLIREGNTLTEIARQTRVQPGKIKQWREEEINNGNPLPEIKIGIAKKQKYPDEELIELAFLNPGYGFRRFIDVLMVSENFVFDLFIEFKKFVGADPFSCLQDTSNHLIVSFQQYMDITGSKTVPPSFVIRGGGKGRRGAKENSDRIRKAYLPPQEFNWGPYSPRSRN